MKLFKRKPVKPEGRRRSPLNSAGQTAFSYYSQRSAIPGNTGREAGRETVTNRPSKLRGLGERAGLFFLVAVIVLGIINSLSLSTTPRIIELNATSGIFLHSSADYADAAREIFAGSVWNRNKVTISTNKVSKQLKAKFPELTDVSITLPLVAHRPILYVQPTQPVLILNSGGSGYVIGQNGLALLKTTQLPSSIKLDVPIAEDKTGVALAVGKPALAKNDIMAIGVILNQLNAVHMHVSGLTLPAGASELDVRLQAQPYFVKFNLHTSLDEARQQAGTFIAVQRKLQSQHITPSYIDVRVLGRAYYK